MYGYLFQSHFRSYMALFHPVRLLKSKQFEKKNDDEEEENHLFTKNIVTEKNYIYCKFRG